MYSGVESDITLSDVYNKLNQLIRDSTSEISLKLDGITSKLAEAEGKIETLEKENEELKKQWSYNEYKKRRGNIIIFGIQEEENEDLYKVILDFFNLTLLTPVTKSDIYNLFRFGKKVDNKRPITVRFTTLHKKFDILKQGHLLQGKSISITNDLSKEERENHKVLRRHHINAKKQGLQSKIKNNKLIINGDIYDVPALLKLEEEVGVEDNSQQTISGTDKKKNQQKLVYECIQTSKQPQLSHSTLSISEGSSGIKTRVVYGLRSGTPNTLEVSEAMQNSKTKGGATRKKL